MLNNIALTQINLLRGIVIVAEIIATLLLLLPRSGFGLDDTLSPSIENLLSTSNHELLKDSDPLLPILQDFYFQRQYKPAWYSQGKLNDHAMALLNTLQHANTHGLRLNDYNVEYFQQHLDSQSIPERSWMEILMTLSLMRYSQHMRTGRLSPQDMGPDWRIEKPEVDVLALTNLLLKTANFEHSLDALAPPYSGYKRLQQAMENYLAIDSRGGWPVLPEGPVLRVYDNNELVTVLRQRLMIEGDLESSLADKSTVFDKNLVRAVKLFQSRHGLETDGDVGTETRNAMNISVKTRLDQLRLNLERWRWLPRDLGDHFIMINTAAFKLTVYEHNKPLIVQRIIAGMPTRQTPAIAGPVRSVELNPYWYIPHKLAIKDIVPLQQQDPNYLKSMGIRIYHKNATPPGEVNSDQINWQTVNNENFPYLLRQDPGPLNSLGRLKIIFTNNYALYLHDTPKKQLFNEETRAFSSGCIRVENPVDLAAYLLREDPNWTKQALEEAIDSLETVSVELKTPVPLYLVYWTAEVGNDDKVYFRRDIYGWDTSQLVCS